MKTQIIAICVPSKGLVSMRFAATYRELQMPLNAAVMCIYIINKPVAEARNDSVESAFEIEDDKKEIGHFMWLDDDVLCNPFALIKLWSHNRDIVSGVYFTKEDIAQPLIFPNPGGRGHFVPDQLYEVWAHGHGLCLIKADVYRRMRQEMDLGKDQFGRTQWYKSPTPYEAHLKDGLRYMGGTEDIYFLERAYELGYRPLMDTSMAAFGWHYCKERQTGFPRKQWEQSINGQPIIWDTPNGPVVWERPKSEKDIVRPKPREIIDKSAQNEICWGAEDLLKK